MERDKAEQFVWKITDYCDNIGDEDGAIDLLNDYANQRVIEELEDIIEVAKPLRYQDKHDVLLERIRELKQE